MTLKSLVQVITTLAEQTLPLGRAHTEDLGEWAGLHGWDIADVECQRLVARQAVLNALMLQVVPGLASFAFPTPLDSLNIPIPQSLCETARAQQACATTFNFWGELYSALIPQARRRRLGQFWTDSPIAEWMVAWLLQSKPRYLADVGCGAGNFLLQAAQHSNPAPQLYGCEISPLLLNVTRAAFLTRGVSAPAVAPILVAQNYLDAALPVEADAIICNPPYTRHHHIAPEAKDALQAFFKRHLHIGVSRQGTLAFFFLLKLVAEMPEGARGAVIVPMEVLDARYGKAAKQVLCQHTTLFAIINFSPQMNAFRKVDVGATILLFTKGNKKDNLIRHLTLCALPTTAELLVCLESTLQKNLPFGLLTIQPQRDLVEIPKWFSLTTSERSNDDWQQSGLVVPLKALAKVVRGIATGANDFFVLPTEQVKQYALEPFVVRTVHRNREIQDIVLDETRWQALSDAGKSVWLLYLNGENVNQYPALRDYLERGKQQGYHHRRLVQTRKQWYLMERREIPAIFFTILTRGNPRFILNRANVRPVNMFSLIYPNRYIVDADAVEILWILLNSDFSLARLYSISRTYGGNTLKVEPRELDNLPVINPLALSEDAKTTLKKWINDFYRHQQASVLMRQVNALVNELLGTSSERRSSMPLQPRLLERSETYN